MTAPPPSHRPSVAAVYLRVSTEEQRERQSIQTQRGFGERYCDLHQISVYRVYADDGVSGTVPIDKRPEGQRILDAARRGEFDQLLVYKLDRLGRETRLILNAVAELERHGVRVRSMTEEFDTATATGRLMLTMLSGFAAHERDMIRERSIAGTERLAHAGAWLGGIVQYGYRKEGDHSKASLVISEEKIYGLAISEADVVRLIFRMAADERKSCRLIAEHLNALQVPCAYVRDGREVLKGKRKQRTSGLWRPGRVRNLLVSATYIGRHEYGKRSKSKERKIITRSMPPIVNEDIWRRAQSVLESNRLFNKRNSKNRYLLRGIAKCGLCELTYIGLAAVRPNGKRDFYYRCNGKHGTRGIYGATGQRCPSKDVNGKFLEDIVWNDIEGFLCDPGKVMEALRERLKSEREGDVNSENAAALISLLEGKVDERNRILALYRRGRIGDDALDAQLKEIELEEDGIKARLCSCQARNDRSQLQTSSLETVGALLDQLRARLDDGLSWELKRQLVEVLVDGITINTITEDGKRRSSVAVRYRFSESVKTCTGTLTSPLLNLRASLGEILLAASFRQMAAKRPPKLVRR